MVSSYIRYTQPAYKYTKPTVSASSDRQASNALRGRVQASKPPVGQVVTNAPVSRAPVTSRTGSYGYSGYEAPGAPPASRSLRGGGSQNIQAPPTTTPSRGLGPINWQDSAYASQIAAIDRALRDFETGAQTRGERYGTDYLTGLRRLGYRPAEGFQAMPNLLEAAPAAAAAAAEDAAPQPMTQAVSGGFDIEGQYDPFSAAAMGTRSARDEFAARGTLRSSDFARNFAEFQNRLNQQLEGMETGRSRFAQDLATEIAQQRTAAEERRGQTRRDAENRAIMRAISEAGF